MLLPFGWTRRTFPTWKARSEGNERLIFQRKSKYLMGNWVEESLSWLVRQQKEASPEEEQSNKARLCFQWGGTFFVIYLLILNHTRRRRSPTQTSLLVAYLLSSLPTVFFNILRGQIGQWVAFLAVASHLFSYSFQGINISTVSRLLLIVIIPSSLAHGLHDSIAGGVLCLVIAVLLLLEEIRETGGFDSCEWDLHCFKYCFGISFLFFFTIQYLFMGFR